MSLLFSPGMSLPWSRRWSIGSSRAELATLLEELDACLAAFPIDEGTRIELSVALREAIANAIYHGNLGVSSELKEQDEEAFERLVEARRVMSPYRERRAHVTVSRVVGALRFVVSDQGEGFDPSKVRDPTAPENLERLTGRGLFVIRSSMDEVVHEDGGRRLVMLKHLPS